MENGKTIIICATTRKYSPYVEFYSAQCEKNNIDYLLVTKETEGYEITQDKHVPFILTNKMMAGFPLNKTILWYRYIFNLIKTKKCNKIIVLPTRTGIVLSPFLLTTKIKYIFDIRDYTKEDKAWYRFIEKLLLKKAEMTVISSKGFLKWLPYRKNINIVHNMPVAFEQNTNERLRASDHSKIKVSYVGMVDYYQQNVLMADALHDSQRYSLKYSGSIVSRCKIKEYVEEKNYFNVEFTGPFTNSEKQKLYEDTDMINAIYGNDSLIVSTALPNKLYDSAIYKIPIIASKGTFLGQLVEEWGLGVAIDVVNDDIVAVLDDFWKNFDYEAFHEDCNRFLESVLKEQQETCNNIKNFLTGENTLENRNSHIS